MIPTTKGMLLALHFTRDTKNTDGTTSLEAGEGRTNVGSESGEGVTEYREGTTESEIESEIESKIKIEIVDNENDYDETADREDNVKYME
jgi:hypothetical protein